MSVARLSLRILALVVVLTIAALPLAARDQSEYGKYLGTRLRMYEQAYAVLDKAGKSTDPAERRKAVRYKAEVMRSEADFLFAADANEDDRRKRYQAALAVFGEGTPDSSEGILDKARLQLDVARVLQRTDPDLARSLCDQAITLCGTERERLENVRNNDAEWKVVYSNYSKLYYTFCVGYYVKALTYDSGHEMRLALLTECERMLDNFQFGLDAVTEEQVISFELQGDIEMARGRLESAVGKFVGLAEFLNSSTPNAYVGRLALENGYLRAAAVLTTDLDYDPKFLQQVITLFTRASQRYGAVRGLEFQFKSFQLYRISALIKLGATEQIQGAVDQLLSLAQDREPQFRRQAMAVLADIAVRDALTLDMRFRCASVVYGDLESLSVPVLLSLVQAHQSILLSCGDVQAFESYAPACYERIGNIFFRMWRFLDAALAYREAATRCSYFVNKFETAAAVPAHMLNRTALITDTKSLLKFPSEMANEYAKNAGLLVNAQYGEPGNTEFARLLQHANQIKAILGGEEAERDLLYRKAGELLGESKFVPAAVRYASLPTTYRRYYLAMAQVGAAYYNAGSVPTIQRVNAFGAQEERESDEWFALQKSRHAEGLEGLPPSMWQGHDSHWDEIMRREATGQVAAWHKSVYYFKRYFLFEVVRSWPEVSVLLNGKENPDYVDGILAVAQAKSTAWMRANPTGKGEVDPDMNRIGRMLLLYIYNLRNPGQSQPGLREKYLGDVTRLLTQYWKLFGTHLEGREEYKQRSLQMTFWALAEGADVYGAEAAYLAYQTEFAKDNDEVVKMVTRMNSLIRDHLWPDVVAMTSVSTGLKSLSNQLKMNLFANVVEVQYPEDAKKVKEATSEPARQKALADHFWNEWVQNKIFKGERAEAILKLMPDVQQAVQKRWEEMAESGQKRWADAVKAELEARIKDEAYAPAVSLVQKEVMGAPAAEMYDRLKKLRDDTTKSTTDSMEIKQAVASLFNAMSLYTDPLRYFVGTVFVYELARFFDVVAADVDERTRPVLTFVLRYYEEYQVKTGETGAGLSADVLRGQGGRYFRIRDWEQTIRYLGEFLTRYGGPREYGREEEVFVDQRERQVGRVKSGEELEVKYLLGRAYLERYKLKQDPEDLKQAALLMRRCWCFNLVRDANELSGGTSKYILRFQSEIENYYLYIGQSMAEIFLLLHTAPEEIKIEWPKYANQYTRTLEVDKNEPVQAVPTDKASALWQSGEIWLRIWSSYQRMDAFQYRDEFRSALTGWLENLNRWVETYGNKDMGIAQLKANLVHSYFSSAVTAGRNESALGATYMNEDTRTYIARLKELTDKLEASCRKASIKVGN